VRLAAVAAVGLSVLAGCREQAPEQDQTTVAVVAKPRIEVGVSGCAGLVEDPERGLVCLTRKPKPLHLWLDGASDPKAELRFDDMAVVGEVTVDPDGVLIKVDLPDRRGQLEVETQTGSWAVTLVTVSDEFEVLRKEVQTSWAAADAAAAFDRLQRAQSELAEPEAALLACSVAQVMLAAGDHDRVLAIAEQASDSTNVTCAAKTALLATYVQVYLRPDFNAAERSLRAAERARDIDLDVRITAAYYRGALQHWLGHIDESLLDFARAARLARHIGDEEHHASAVTMQAVSLARLGRFSEAEALAREAEQLAAELGDRTLALDIRSDVGWIAVLRREDEPTLADPSPAIRDLITAYAGDDRRKLTSRRLELVLTLLQNRDLDAAARELSALDPEALDPELLVWFEMAAVRLELLHGRTGAVAERHLDRAQVLADLNQDRELEWRVAILRGELERTRGRNEAAIEWFQVASRLADELALSVAGHAGRSRFVTTHSRADVALVELHLARGDATAAICTAMAVRARHLRGLWARLRPPLSDSSERSYRDLLSRHRERKQEIAARLERSWTLSTVELEALREQLGAEGERADQLLAEATALLEDGAPTWSCDRTLPRDPGEAVLTMSPGTESRQWTAMLARRTQAGQVVVEAMTVELASPEHAEAAANLVLDEFAPVLEQTRSLRVIPIGAFVTVDFHRLWLARGQFEPIITYSLGLGEEPGAEHSLPPSAVVLAGSTDLAAVAREVATVESHLHDRGWNIASSWTPTSDAQPSLLHYAGHGFDGEALGWQSAIEVPDHGRVSAAQIVASQRSPELVVLGACSAGRVTADSIDGGMNLAAAFLLAGARLVIAPIREVDDAAALELGTSIYREFDVNDPPTLARSLATLQREQIARDPVLARDQSFSSWRAWTP
jgi:tetratricopeptide (TPR) repeat protein